MISVPSSVLLKSFRKSFQSCLIGAGLVVTFPAFAADEPSPVVLQTHLHPPYQVMRDHYLSGEVPKTLNCIFKWLDRPYVINLAPRKRSRQLIKANRIDGFFLSTPDEALDETSLPTEPLALERWKYYRLKGSDLPAVPNGDQRVGAVLGSNEAVWLKQHYIPHIQRIPDMESLVKVLQSQRLSYVLVDERAFEEAAAKYHLPNKVLESHFVRYVPLVAYFSKVFIKENPGFLDAFNASLDSCVTGIRDIKQEEKDYVLKVSNAFVQQHGARILAEMKEAAFANLSMEKRHDEDKRWTQAMLNNQTTGLMGLISMTSLSQTLTEQTAKEYGMTEIFVMDRNGFILGMNKPTSDFWQGDEVAFDQVLKQGKDHYVSKIEFDHSTRRFQIQVTLPLMNAASKEPVGAITIGFDADRAFQS
ncbi:MAG: hypothetical protein HWE30_03300 [Methylocystaceae bacterium]|nr:hypothetical protein [Methylocystaceae bacterium]